MVARRAVKAFYLFELDSATGALLPRGVIRR